VLRGGEQAGPRPGAVSEPGEDGTSRLSRGSTPGRKRGPERAGRGAAFRRAGPTPTTRSYPGRGPRSTAARRSASATSPTAPRRPSWPSRRPRPSPGYS